MLIQKRKNDIHILLGTLQHPPIATAHPVTVAQFILAGRYCAKLKYKQSENILMPILSENILIPLHVCVHNSKIVQLTV